MATPSRDDDADVAHRVPEALQDVLMMCIGSRPEHTPASTGSDNGYERTGAV